MTEETKQQPEKNSPEWRASHADLLRKAGETVAPCHPWIRAIRLRDGRLICGYMGDITKNEPSCGTTLFPGVKDDPARDGYQPEAHEYD